MQHKNIYQLICIISLVSLFGLNAPMQSNAKSSSTGARPDGLSPTSIHAVESILPFFVDVGQIDISINALGTLSSSGYIEIEKPNMLATVRAAYLLAATTGFSYYSQGPLADGDVLLDGYPVNWTVITETSISSYNHLADVTDLVWLKYNTSLPGIVSFLINEADTYRTDGVVLVVIYNNPLQSVNNTIALLFGAQNVAGDSFEITFTEPIDTDNESLVLDMSLGISYGAQACNSGQYSQIDVNGNRLSTSAGGEDDGICNNGALITVGGLGDSNSNPADPFQNDNGDPRQDDELYDLKPFVSDGDTKITVDTLNPSADDNIFMAAFRLTSQATVSTQPKRPVIFIPGFGGSRLNEGDEEIWPAPLRLINDNDDAHLDALILTEAGLDPPESNISVGDDIVRRVVIDIYDGTVNTLEDLGYTENDDLFVFPYDFRKDISTTASILEDFISIKLGDTQGTVDIIAHSQGGLVTKQCVLRPSCAEKVNSVAILGTPFAGAPGVIQLLEYGARIPDNLIGYAIGVSPNRSKIISQNWPNTYQLIPGPNFYALYGKEYFIYDRDLDGDGNLEGALNYESMKSFLSDRHNATLVDRGEEFQQIDGIANWINGTNGVNVVIFAGTGLPTMTEIREHEWHIGPITYVDVDFSESNTGDETVNAISVALRNEFGVDFTGDNVNIFYMDNVNHGQLPKNRTLLQYVTTIFANAPDRSEASNLNLATASMIPELPPPPQEILTEPTYVYGRQFLFSGEVNVDIYDELGNRTGRGDDDKIEAKALGTTYTEIGNTVSIFVHGNGTYTMTVQGQDAGHFDLKARTVEESIENRQVLFSGVPYESNMEKFRLVYNTEIPQAEDILEADKDGDGIYEIALTPDGDISGEVLNDVIPPLTTINLEGEELNGAYKGSVQVTLTAIDPDAGSGIATILYSLDGGNTLQEYSEPFTIKIPGTTEIHALAIDKAGNRETNAKSQSVNILSNMYLPLLLH